MSALLRMTPVLFLAVLPGCISPLCANRPRECYNPDTGYRFDSLEPDEKNTDSLFICLTFSGGGTRAAALAYGVLLGLQDATFDDPSDGAPPRCLLDEVDVISSVSGGSFTAMGYALWGDQLFDGEYEKRFLRHNIQWDLIVSALKPKNMLRLPSILLDRIDVAAFYYDEEIFKRATYADLADRNRRPFVVINATDLTRQQRFEFTQDDFDLLGSDLESLPVGWAVAASSAFPILLSPLRLEYFHGEVLSAAVQDVLTEDEDTRNLRRYGWAESLLDPDRPKDAGSFRTDQKKRRYLYLMDGGLADNLGLTCLIEAYRKGAIRRKIEAGLIDRLVVIIVNAGTDPPEDIERKAAAPGLFEVGIKTGTTGMYNHSALLAATVRYALLEVQPKMRQAYRECPEAFRKDRPDATLPELPHGNDFETYVVDVNFHRIQDKRKRRSFLSMITSFFLPTEDVRALIDAGRDLVLKDPQFRRLMVDLEKAGAASPAEGSACDEMGK